MAEDYVSMKVGDLDRMIQYYEEHLHAELIDQTDTSALLLLGHTLFEFVLGKKGQGCLAISWDSYDGFKDFVDDLGLKVNVFNHHYRSSLEDIESNIVIFSYYNMVVPSDIFVERI